MADIDAKHQARMAEIDAKHQARLNDHEEVLLDHEQEHRRLLQAQIIMKDSHDKTEAELQKLTMTVRETTEKLNALIEVVEDFIRRQPKQ